MTMPFDEMRDVVVVGSGAAGMAAALTAAAGGLDVAVVEKTDFIGGGTAVSGGAVWVPGNAHANALGIPDSREAVLSYLRAILGNRLRTDMIASFLDHGPEAIAFLEAKTSLRFVARSHSPDYQPDLPGAALGGRTIDPEPFDARELGADFGLLRPPLKEFLAFGGMMVGRKDIDALLGAARSWEAFRHSAGLLLRYARDRIGHPRGTRLLMGNALAGRLLKSAVDLGLALRVRTEALRLIQADDRVVGVEVRSEGRRLSIGARRGVVLAAGGAPADPKFRAAHVPYADRHYSMAPGDNTGDGIRLGLSVAGALASDNVGAAFWTPVSVMREDGTETRFPHLILDRQKPGLIAVNGAGRRFVNEAVSYHEFVEAMHRSHETVPTIPAFLICDRRFLRRYGLGLVRPGPRPLGRFLRAGYLVEGPTIEALADRLSVPAKPLREAVERMNEAARTGADPEFGKGSNAYQRYLGDPAHRPNPCLGPISDAPFYAVRVFPGDIGTATGLATDARARVLRADGRAVPGLHAVGNDMNSIMAGTYPGAGITLGPALTFGYIAGRALVEEHESVLTTPEERRSA